MVARGYTTVRLVAEELGNDFTDSDLISQCDALIEPAEAWIDRQTGRAWLASSPTTDELHTLSGPVVYLDNKPVTAVTSVRWRNINVGAQDVTLTAGTGYELLDATNGILLIAAWPSSYDIVTDSIPSGALLKVSYTSATPVPADIQRAATLLVANWMQARMNSDTRGVDSYQVGSSGDTFQVKFRDADAPSEVLQIVRAHEAILFG